MSFFFRLQYFETSSQVYMTWKPRGNIKFPTHFQVASIMETTSQTGLQGMETERKLQVSNPIPTGFHRGNRAVSAFQTHGNHWFPLWKPGGNHLETPGFHVVSNRFPRFGNLSFRPVLLSVQFCRCLCRFL